MNYGELKSAIAAWSKRSDMTAQIPIFVGLAQERLNRELRARQMIASTTLAATGGVETIALPNDWMSGASLDIDGVGIEYRSPEALRSMYPSSYSGHPLVYTVEGTNLVLGPKPDQNYSIRARYYARLGEFANDAATDWLLTAYPGAYLFACLVELSMYGFDRESAAVWESRLQTSMSDINQAESSAASGGTGLRMRAS